jgi:hypothetical protein
MLSRIRTRLTFANVVSLLALFVALGGSVYAAGKLNGTTIKRASLPGNRIVPNSVKGKQVREGSLGQVPRAGVANAAFSTSHFDAIDLPDSTGTIATLDIPSAGAYVITAKFTGLGSTAGGIFNARCTLTAGSDVDNSDFDVLGNGSDDTEQVVLQVAHDFDAPGAAVLACADNDAGDIADALYTRVTAIQVKSLTNTTF